MDFSEALAALPDVGKLPKPYFQRDGITLYHGDCRRILPLLPAVDLMLTDPPYGISWSRGHGTDGKKISGHAGIIGDEDTSLRDWVLENVEDTPGFVFGSLYAQFPKSLAQVLIWHKPADSGVIGSVTGFRRDAEAIFMTGSWPVRTCVRSSVIQSFGGISAVCRETGHPHTKPIELIRDLINFAGPKRILDPFAGSGTTLRAAMDFGLEAIGIEIDERYCEVAAKRLAQRVLPF